MQNKETIKKIFKLFLKLAVSSGILYFLFVKFNYSAILHEIKKFMLHELIFIFSIYLFSVFISAIKWRYLLATVGITDLFLVLICSRFYSIALPGQLFAEVSKVALLPKNCTDIGNASVSIIMDKITGMLSLFFLGVIGVTISNHEIPNMLCSILWCCFFAVLLIICLCNSLLMKKLITRIYQKFKLNILFSDKKRSKLFDYFFEEKEKLHIYNTKNIFMAVLAGIFYQLVNTEVFVLIGKSMDINVSFGDWMWVIAILSVALLVPISLAGIGIREGTLVTFLALLAVDGQKAMAVSVVFFAIQLTEGAIGGVILAARKLIQLKGER